MKLIIVATRPMKIGCGTFNFQMFIMSRLSVSIVERAFLEQQIGSQENWAINFLAQDPLQMFRVKLINPFPEFLDSGRGTRADRDDYQILSYRTASDENIEPDFLIPAVESSQELLTIIHTEPTSHFLFHCSKPEAEIKRNFPNAWRWIQKFSQARNKKGFLYPEVLAARRPHWYSLRVEAPANVFISINPNKKLFFAYSAANIYLNQRLVSIRVPQQNVQLITALLNSIVSLMIVEFNGVARNLGALDLNADFFKTKMKILNPALLSDDARSRIIEAFQPLSERIIQDFDTEYASTDRIHFDEIVLQEFG